MLPTPSSMCFLVRDPATLSTKSRYEELEVEVAVEAVGKLGPGYSTR